MSHITVESATQVAPAVVQTNVATSEEKTAEQSVSATEEVAEETTDESETSEEGEETKEDEESSDVGQTDEEKTLKAKKKGGFKKRIDKLNAKLTDKDREIEHWKKEALRNLKEEKSKPEVQAKTEAISTKPDPDKFDSHEDYIDALTDWKVEKKLSDKEQKSKQETQVSEFQAKVSSHQEKVNAFREKTEDFDEVLESVDDIELSLAVQDLILDSENGAELVYELAKNRDEFAKICKMSPMAAARELGKFESKLAKAASAETKTTPTTKAPPPIKTISSGKAVAAKDPHNMSYEEYKSWRAKQKG